MASSWSYNTSEGSLHCNVNIHSKIKLHRLHEIRHRHILLTSFAIARKVPTRHDRFSPRRRARVLCQVEVRDAALFADFDVSSSLENASAKLVELMCDLRELLSVF